MTTVIKIIIVSFCVMTTSHAKSVEYELNIDYKNMTVNGVTTKGMAINGSVPAPTLTFTEGNTAIINVINKMDVDTSIHWHGLLLPNHQDGVPYVNHPPISAGEEHEFKFKIRQAGTYWYHSHTGLQEQRGVYGAIVILPKVERELAFDQESTVVLSDWVNENPDEVLRTLKSGSDYYSIKKGSKQNLLSAIDQSGVGYSVKQSLKRMPGMDISDVAYDSFFANGSEETFIPAKAGKILKLRLVNAATASYFTLQFSDQNMQIVAADGIDVKPVYIQDFIMAIAETYTLLIKVPENGMHELRATAQDGTGFSSIWIGTGEKHSAPDRIKPNPYRMNMAMPSPNEKMAHHDGQNHHHEMMDMPTNSARKNQTSNTPYKQLKSLIPTVLPAENTTREIELNLTGDMERYVWSINDEVLSPENTIKVRRGENLRFILKNKTMMHHPMHLHGHFFRMINGAGDYSPLKHTVDVPPMAVQVIEFEANEFEDWFFHCHILYHAKSGMARVISYEEDTIDIQLQGIRHKLYADQGFFYASGSFLSQMTDGIAVISNEKNSLRTDWQVGWQNVDATEYEVNLSYERYFDRFLTGFAGMMFENNTERGIFGIRYLLPLNFETEWRIDTHAELRVTIGNSIQLINNMNLYADFEYDTETKEEWSAGLQYTLTKNMSLMTQYHSEFGIGAGFRINY